MARNSTIRDRHRSAIRNRHDPCHICGQAIDYTLPYLHPGSFVVDHVIPYAKGGPDTLDNKAASHRACNRRKSDHMPFEDAPVNPFLRVTTDRVW